MPPTNVAVVGAGVSGLAAGLEFQAAGFDFTIFEKASDVGGTWRENRYPGLTIDVPSPLYTYEGFRNPHWRWFLPPAAEILDYHRDVSRQSGLHSHIRFNSEVESARWTGEAWELTTTGGAHHSFRVLVCASGFLHHPRWPAIDGLETFGGELVHSAQWRDEIVVEGRRVGVVGNGSTGVQLVGALGGVASHLTLFQRTPQWIFPSFNFPIPARARAAFERRPRLADRTARAFSALADWLLGAAARGPGVRRRFFDVAARLNLRTVRDLELRRRLTPRDAALCKRPVISNRFYRALQRPDVTLADSAIERVQREGVVTADGRLHELDVLVMATGFQAHNFMRPMHMVGEDGVTLDEAWSEGPYGYRTMAVPGFPNMFMVLGPHSPLVSIPIHLSAELQSRYIRRMIEVIDSRDLAGLAPREEATRRWLEYVGAGMNETVWSSGCTSWYLGAGDVPVLWPYDVARWREVLGELNLGDYVVRSRVGPGEQRVAA